MKYVCCMALIMFMAHSVFAAEEAPQSFTLDGRLYTDNTGTSPLLDPNVTLTFQILSHDQTCILYEETRTNFDSSASDGYFSLPVGSEVGNPRRTAGYTSTMSMVYSNTSVGLAGKRVSDGTNCTYNPVAGDERFLRITVGTSVGSPTTRVLSPNMALNSVPHATVAERAETLQGLGPTNFLRPNTTGSFVLSQSNLENLFTSANQSALSSLLSGTSGLYTKAASNGTAVLPSASAPSTPSAGQIWYDAGVIKYYDGASSTIRTISTGTSTQVSAAGGTAAAPSISFAGDTDTGWYAPAADTLAAATGGTEKVRITPTGNFGVGTTDPTFGTAYGANETVVGVSGKNDSTNAIGRFVLANTRPTATNLDYTGAIDFVSVNNPGAEKRAAGIYSKLSGAGGASGYGGDLQFYTKDDNGSFNQKMVLSPSGNIGIGTTAPVFAIDVQKTNESTILNLVNTDTVSPGRFPGVNVVNYMGSTNNGVPTISLTNLKGNTTAASPLIATNRLGTIAFRGGNSTTPGTYNQSALIVSTAEEGFSATAGGANLTFATTTNGTTTATERMRIAASGNVGIGTTAPNTRLSNTNLSISDDAGDSASSTGFNWIVNSNSAYSSVIGNSNTGSTTKGLSIAISANSATSRILNLRSDGIDQVVVTGQGNVGIGTTAPGRLLHVNGPMRVQPAALPTTPAVGDIAVDSGDSNKLKYYNGSVWLELGAGSSGSFTSVSSISNSSGDITLAPQTTTGKVAVTSGTPSTSSTSGALVVTGGLGVSENINAGGTISAATSISAPTTYSPQIYGSSAASGNIKIDGTSNATKGNVLLATAGGNVGIGTTTPAFPLDVAGVGRASQLITNAGSSSVQAGLILTNTATTSGSGTQVNFNMNGTPMAQIGNVVEASNTDSSLTFSTRQASGAPTEKVRILANGNVGIGTTDPTVKLALAGEQQIVTGYSAPNSPLSIYGNAGSLGNSSTLYMYANSPNLGVHLNNASTGGRDWTLISSGNTSSYGVGNFNIGTNSGGAYSPFLSISSGGNVGIGTTNPNAKLNIASTGSNTSVNVDTYGTTYIPRFVARQANGTQASPTATVLNDIIAEFGGAGFDSSAFGTVPAAGMQIAASETHSAVAKGANIRFFTTVTGSTTPTERIRISSGGNVGIGTTTPSERLAVVGGPVSTDISRAIAIHGNDGNGAGFIGSSGAADPTNKLVLYANRANGGLVVRTPAGESMTVKYDGNVGIGTTNPLRPLHVAGPMRVEPTALPSSPANGDIAIDSADGNKLKYYNGSWQTVGASTNSSNLTDISTITNSAGDITLSPVTTTGKVVINSGTPSTSSTTGALVVTGGAGVSGNLNVGGTVFANDYSGSNIYISQSGANVFPTAGVTAYSNSGRPQLNFTRTRGTYVSPTAVSDGDETGLFQAMAHNGTQIETSSGVSFKVDNVNATGSGNHPGGRIDFSVRGTTDATQYGLTPALTVRNTGRVGIGTTIPGLRTEVMGVNSMPNSSGTSQAGALRISQSSSTSVLDMGVGGSGAAWLQSTNSSNLGNNYSINLNPNGGPVSIGATIPQQGTLYVEKPTATGIGADLWLSNSATGAVGNKTRVAFSSDSSIDSTPNAGIENVMTGISPNLSDLTFNIYDGTAYNEKMRVKSDGSVGIGTSAPIASLHVSGQGTSGASIFVDGYGGNLTSFIGRAARGTQSAPTPIQSGDQLAFFGARGNTSSGFATNSSAGIFMNATENFTSTGQGANITFETTVTGSTAATGRTEKMRINSSGVVGIGTTSPASASKLEVGGQIRSVEGSTGAAKNNSTTSVDWSLGNNQSMSVACTASAFTNMLDGATYNLAVTDTNATQCNFSQAGLTFYYTPANGSRISGLITFYSFTRIGSNVYVAWSAMNP